MSDKPGLLLVGELPEWDVAALEADFHVFHYWRAADKAAMLAEARDSTVAIVTKGEIGADGALMDALPKTKIIACYGVGVDAIDLDAARARGIPVTNTPDVLTEEVADFAILLMLGAARRVRDGDAWVRSGAWAARGPMALTTRVSGKRLGIVGLGRIGSAIARRAEGFGMPIAYSARTRKDGVAYDWYPTPAAMAPHVDVLCVAAAGGAATRGLVDRTAIEALPPGVIFVNVSRGTVVDEAALLDALRQGRIGAAGLDVFLNEPNIDPEFLTFPNVLLQPHAASGSIETRKDMGRLMRENVAAAMAGRTLPTRIA
ncbi:2-hydroxyacid dehydrogenase [Falsiroseomonas stagni]|uniref:D-3-phosphoglycerate dehydrogenase n=1 Tax=Falsiroseomonas stagni DSM 19981 TaxID=1123062 RepID=A0A1I4CA08_9PROT|nr:2-hydroxyacid dehydrogenase [Falsiroseomonas stagni]SFK77765.1 D-3-phosphoglycerate dehydrogenase [Falsiroseomonas stagni DSM 19981]